MTAVPLTKDEREELTLLETVCGADAVLTFVRHMTPKWEPPEHLRPFAEAFARMEYQPVRLLVSVPRRHGKTELILHALARWLCRHPDKTAAYVSYSGEFSEDKSKRLRDIAVRAGLHLRDDSRKANLWRTPQGGGIIAPGIGGQMTGHGVNVLVVDDPHKNREEAESATVRRGVLDWFTSTGITSVEPGGSVIVCHTRWHQDDLIGTLSQDKEVPWQYMNLPAINDAGEALWPSRWPLDELARRRREVSPYDWESLYQGQPRPRGARVFLSPTRYEHPRLHGAKLLISCDPAATAKTSADKSAILVGAMTRDDDGFPCLDILDARALQVEVPALVRELRNLQQGYGCGIAVEAVGGFAAVPQMLRAQDRNLQILDIHPQGDKFVRTQDVAAAWNDGRVRVPQSAPWLTAFCAEVERFTGIQDAHDDYVDALAHLWNTITKMVPRHPYALGERQAPRMAMG